MKTYIEQADGHFQIDGINIPPNGNKLHKKMLKEIGKGEAEIEEFKKPVENDSNDILRQIQILKNEKLQDAMIDFMDGKKTTFTKFKKELDALTAKL